MKIRHRISFLSDENLQRELNGIGVSVGDSGFCSFDAFESQGNWREINEWIIRRSPIDIVETQFSRQEMMAAKWLQMLPNWHWGYPQPDEGNFGYRNATYDLENYCDLCGVGLIQKRNFIMKSEPNWKNRAIVQLNWIFDEYFVNDFFSDILNEEFKIESMRVMNVNGGIINGVRQIIVPDRVDVKSGLIIPSICAKCGREKFKFISRGYFPSIDDNFEGHICKTNQYFGSGSSASQAVIVSRYLYNTIMDCGIKGVGFIPLEN